MGESGSGKSTLFRAIAGLWPWGSGMIRIPPPEQMMFLPQRPYLPLGTLRAAVQLSGLAGHLRRRRRAGGARALRPWRVRWTCSTGTSAGTSSLSLGQQQRVAFARVILHKPQWVFMDEATSALDEENQASMLALFENELKGASVLSIGHRPGLEEFHTRTLHIRKTSEGAVLLAPSRCVAPQPKLGPRWIGRFRRKLRPAHAQEG